MILSFSYLLHPISVYSLVVSILVKILYAIYIIFSAESEIFEVMVSNMYLQVDLSYLNYFFLVIPGLMIVRSILKYIYDQKELICTLIILEAILLKGIHSKTKIRKYILKDKRISRSIKRNILKGFNNIIVQLEYNNSLIVQLRNGYLVTKKGQEFFNQYRCKINSSHKNSETFQVWTESELEELALKRAKKRINRI